MLLSKGVNMVFPSGLKLSDIKIKTKVVSRHEINEYVIQRILPPDVEIISLQVVPYEVWNNKVTEWLMVIFYKHRINKEVNQIRRGL